MQSCVSHVCVFLLMLKNIQVNLQLHFNRKIHNKYFCCPGGKIIHILQHTHLFIALTGLLVILLCFRILKKYVYTCIICYTLTSTYFHSKFSLETGLYSRNWFTCIHPCASVSWQPHTPTNCLSDQKLEIYFLFVCNAQHFFF